MNQSFKDKLSAPVLTILLTLQGALKSWTIWINALVLAFPYLVDNVALLQPLLPANYYTKLAVWLPIVNALLRFKTTMSLAEKGDKPTSVGDSLRSVLPMLLLGLLGLAMMLPVPAQAAVADPVWRAPDGSIYRSAASVHRFRATHLCPATGRYGACSGYIVDHIVPLACAKTEAQRKRLDVPGNMQYQTLAASHAKDLVERKHCPAVI